MSINNPQLRIKLLNILLNHIRSRGWTNYDNFAQEFVDNILIDIETGNMNLERALSKSPKTFFRLNKIPRLSFLSPELSGKIGVAIGNTAERPGLFDEERAISTLEKMNDVRLSSYEIVEDYIRYDGRARQVLKDFKQKILASFLQPTKAHENYLIWATPGSGKTFFVKQLARLLKQTIRFFDFNLASMTEAKFRTGLSELDVVPGAALCFIDEIDSKPNESWPYETLIANLDAPHSKESLRAFIMAGSSGSNLTEMKVKMGRSPKGSDLLSRVPRGNEFQIPPLTLEDKILLTLGSLKRAGTEAGKSVSEVEKLAIYYVIMQPELDSPRQLRELAIRSVERMPVGEDRVKYDNLFTGGDESSKLFWMHAKSVAPKLINSFTRIE
jgi:hypothetical protein